MDEIKNIVAIIFDCDGVMFDSRAANVNFYNHLLSRFGLPPMDEDQVEFVHMRTADESVRKIFEGTPHLEEAQAYRLTLDYTPFIRDMLIEPGLKDLLKQLRPKYRLAVATNRSSTIGEVLRRNGLEGFFDKVVSSLDVKRPKPDPESLYQILDFFGISAKEALYIGDSEVDMKTADAAGMPFVAYRNGSLHTPWHVDSLMDIKGILEYLGQ